VSAQRFTLPAYAKINLGLRVVGRRTDGYHEIRTVFQTITLHDRLTFEPLDAERLELTCAAPDIPTDESNLVLRAGLALRERFGVRVGARVELDKRIPAQGGLGGGSSDAAVALLGFARLWGLRPDREELTAIGARLGSDIPFFLTGGTALGTGRGTTISPCEDGPVRRLLVVTPGAGVSTAEAYRALNAPALTKQEPAAILHVSCVGAQISGPLREALRNDFEAVVFRLEPEIERARDRLLEAGASAASLSGSGASVFGMFDSDEAWRRAAEALGGEAGWQVFPCETLLRGEYLKSLGGCAALLM
jgi:4-diphosphocytidyl-2-C-methyl-D-erythritol kinase